MGQGIFFYFFTNHSPENPNQALLHNLWLYVCQTVKLADVPFFTFHRKMLIWLKFLQSWLIYPRVTVPLLLRGFLPFQDGCYLYGVIITESLRLLCTYFQLLDTCYYDYHYILVWTFEQLSNVSKNNIGRPDNFLKGDKVAIVKLYFYLYEVKFVFS